MDNRDVSTLGIAEGIDYLQNTFIANLDDQTDQVLESYKAITSQGILSSANIDAIVLELKGKISQIQNNFDTMAQQLKTQMSTSQEEIEANRSDIEGQMQG